MGNQKLKWTAEEEEALLAGIAKYGPGKWKNILRDPEFAPSLVNRSNIDLKDKWRNLSVSGPGSKEKLRLPKGKALPALQNSVAPASAAPAVLADNTTTDAVIDDPSNSLHDSKNACRYNELIIETLSTITDSNGADIGTILSYIEERLEVPPNFRRLLGSRLRRLVLQGKLEKVQNNYRVNRDVTVGTNPPTPKQKDVKPRPIQAPSVLPSHETMQEAAMAAAYKVAEAENKAFLASEAVKEAERVSKMADDTDAMLQLVKEICEQCKAHGASLFSWRSMSIVAKNAFCNSSRPL
ncbi:telomere repeat-binding factor 4-like isoform X1 [Punica granatum]|uniref:MYB transcription factor n=1 Tax=Punica granatum TaxID=22663 RepID=A0A6P8E3C5_PUNGR|nr:telomere repeat-binding factor 4-like isoform X1 [Punica granatum]